MPSSESGLGLAGSGAGLPVISLLELGARTLGIATLALLVVFVLNQWQGVPLAGVILLGLVLVFAWITKRTRFGLHIYAVGGNAEAARRAGIHVTRIRITVFVLCSLLAAFGGRGSVWSAPLRALVIGSVSNGLDLTGQPADIKYIVQGAILLAAVTIDAISRRERTSAGRA